MGGGAQVDAGAASRYNYAKIATALSFICCMIGQFGGMMYGYDIGVGGGVASMRFFEETYFPAVYEMNQTGANKSISPYCKYNDAMLQLFQSSLYLAGFFSSLVSSWVVQHKGRKFGMLASGICYCTGVALTSGAVPRHSGLGMLIMGRIMLGIGMGFGNAACNIYAAEMSPPKYRGFLSCCFQLFSTIGILIAQSTNYGVKNMYPNGWRISLALAGVPALGILCAGIFLPETPTHLMANNRVDEGRKVLQRLRGQEDVELEVQDIIAQTRETNKVKHPLKELFKPCYRPQLIISVVLNFIHVWCGNNAITFYSAQLFSILGSSHSAALLNTVILGAVKVAGAATAVATVDKFGRRNLLIYGGSIMVASNVVTGSMIGAYFKKYGTNLPKDVGTGILAVICIFLFFYEASWGPLSWLVTAEVQPSEVRTAGMGLGGGISLLSTFVIAQTFQSMMCGMQYWTFIFFALLLAAGIIFVIVLLPECKGLHVEEVHEVFRKHWIWSKCPEPPKREALPEADPKFDIDPKLQENNSAEVVRNEKA